METRIVSNVHKEHGVIATLFGKTWGPCTRRVAIDDIERGLCRYVVEDPPDNNEIRVVHPDHRAPYLRTPPNPRRNLGELREPRRKVFRGRRVVTGIHRVDGVITELYGRNWGPCSKDVVVHETEHGLREYVVEDGLEINPIFVVHTHRGPYLRTPPNPKKNLGDLPELAPVVH